MFTNNLKLSFRHLFREKLYSMINIIGFAIGIASCILILMYVHYETSYDKFYPNSDRIYRIYLSSMMNGQDSKSAKISVPVGPTVKQDFPEVEAYCRLANLGYPVIRYGEKAFSEERWYTSDPGIVDVFSLSFIDGDPATALTEPNSVVLTESMVRKYFGSEDPMGKLLNANNQRDFKVTGIIEDVPPNSHIHYDFLASIATYQQRFNPQNWFDDRFYTYILLKEGTDPNQLEEKFHGMVLKYMGPLVQMILNTCLESLFEAGARYDLKLQPITDIHLRSNLEFEVETNGDARYVTIFSVIAIFILLIACINFMNLATARSAKRAREVGVRKTFGSNRLNLVTQFLTESISLTLIAVILSMVIVRLILPWYSNLLNIDFHLKYFSNVSIVTSLAAFTFLIGILAGLYPAFFLSSFRPIKVLKANSTLGQSKSILRNGLVLMQFIITILLFSGTLIVNKQIRYMQNKKLGFDKDKILIIEKSDDLGSRIHAFTENLRKSPDILNVSNSVNLFGEDLGNDGYRRDEGPVGDILTVTEIQADAHFAETVGLQLTMGRYLIPGSTADSSACLINESAVSLLGYNDPIGRRIFEISGGPDQHIPYTISGVVKDFHYTSLHHQIQPLLIKINQRRQIGRYTAVRIETRDIPKTLAFIQQEWKKLIPDQAFEYRFMDEHFAQLYRAEQQTRQLVSVFSTLAIFIASLGLFGMASFITEQRTKEIGIRKTMGASISQIYCLLCSDIVKLIVLASLVSLPLSYFLMTKWLQNYAYQIHYDLYGFLLAGTLALLIALLTISQIVINAARKNPVDSLKYE